MRLRISRFLLRYGHTEFVRMASTEAISSNNSQGVNPAVVHETERPQRLKEIGKALEVFLTRAHQHARMMERERADFELGKRHLANIMGWDPREVTQEKIDTAIAYLFPSGLTDKKALPVMKPPEEILPKFHKLDFDDEGRPVDTRFYTLKPRFYDLLSTVGRKTWSLINFRDEQILKNVEPPAEELLTLSGSIWLTQDQLGKKLGERVSDEMYAQSVIALEYLCSLPYAFMERDFIMSYRSTLGSGVGNKLFGPQVPEVLVDQETHRRYATVATRVKRTTVEAKVMDAGSGKFSVNGHHYSVFQSLLAREVLLSSLIVAGKLGQVDVEAKVIEGPGGLTVIPRAVRHAVGLCVAALHPETYETLRLAGMLTQDPRKRERLKINQPGARAKWIWKRR